MRSTVSVKGGCPNSLFTQEKTKHSRQRETRPDNCLCVTVHHGASEWGAEGNAVREQPRQTEYNTNMFHLL